MSEAAPAAPLGLLHHVDANQLRKDAHIDLTDLTTAMTQQPSLFAHYASNTVRAKLQFEQMKRKMEILEAQLNASYRQALNEESDKGKATEAAISAAMRNDPRWKALSNLVIEAQGIYKLAEVAERSIDQRRDMLLQIARDAAREQAGPLRVAANVANRERLLESMKRNTEAA